MKAVKIDRLSFSYGGEQVLSDVSLELPEKSFMVIIGPNGGGKSTFLKLLLGIMPLQQGSIKIFGGTGRQNIGYVPQDNDHIKNFPIDVTDTVLMGFAGQKGLSGKDMLHEVYKNLRLVEMEGCASKRLNELSTGQRQRVFLARAMVSKPKLLVLDEPTSGIDPAGQAVILDVLKSKMDESTIIFVSHDLSVIPGYATSVACINRQLFFHPSGEITSSLLTRTYGDIPSLALVTHSCNCGTAHD